ncbi:hypothetical protein [Roseateles sp.]|uniref:hypothetical protein n=1 Tax=Roseateles sp. TaxID=1971397 RepID=UPI003BA80A0E
MDRPSSQPHPRPTPVRGRNPRRAASGALALTLLSGLALSACGGSNFIDEFVEDTICGVTNCKESETLKVEDISPRYKVTQDNGVVKIDARLSQSANLITVVRPSGSDRMSASIGALRVDLTDISGRRSDYSAKIADASEEPVVTINFHRGAEVYPSTVTMPKPFSVQSPTGTPLIARSTGQFKVQMTQLPSSKMSLLVAAQCRRADGSSFESKGEPMGVALDGAAYRISTLDLDLALNRASKGVDPATPNTSLVQSCDLNFQWTLNNVGSMAPGLNRYGSIVASRSAAHKASYDARL